MVENPKIPWSQRSTKVLYVHILTFSLCLFWLGLAIRVWLEQILPSH